MSVQGVNNRLLTDDIIAKEALRLLKNNLVAAPLVNRSYEKVFAKVGDTISLKKPFRTKTTSGRTLGKQPLVDQIIPFQIGYQENFGVEVTMRDRTLSLQQFSERYLKSGIVQIANKIDKSIFDAMATKGFFTSNVGNAVTTKSFLYGSAYMGNVAVPDDGMRRATLNLMDAADVSDATSKVFNEKMVQDSIQKGYTGALAGFDVFQSQNIPTYEPGAGWIGTPLVKGANQTGSSIIVDGFTTDGLTLKKGDIFTIAGVYEINPQNYTSTGRLQSFVVTADVAVASNQATISISPAINDGSLTTVDASGSSLSLAAYQNVSAKPADNAAITLVGTAGNVYKQNFLFHKDAVTLAMVDLELPQSAVVKARVRDEDSGLSMSMTGAFDINNHTEITRIDAVWGCEVIYPEMLHRLITN
jgi:hypothetical protein